MDTTSTMLGVVPTGPLAPLEATLAAGTVVAERFVVEALAGHGGMGTIYRVMDSHSGRRVALKLLRSEMGTASKRFTREAQVLSELHHPGIVAYVAHGSTPQGHSYIAMEWLEGEDLAQRLVRQPLSLEESLALAQRAAHALAAAHRHGVIHRDLKPSNLFLRHGRAEDVVVLDFGLARRTLPSTVMTTREMVLGSPGYMAPEQVASQSQLTPGADIFSLGCVLYECLTGQPAFRAPHLMATLAKILFAEPTALRELRPELPAPLQPLLEHMLAKDPARRLPDAPRLLEALEELRSQLEPGSAGRDPGSVPLPRLGGASQQLVTVLLAAPRAQGGQEAGAPDSHLALRDSLRSLLAAQGVRVEVLADGALVLTLVASLGSATDPAALAARCAFFLLERWPEAVVVLTTGRGTLAPHLPVGEAMDRAGQLLRQVDALPADASPILLDEVTAGLLGPSFRLTRASPSGIFLLHGEQLGADASRPLLGKPTPCVGREQELTLLDMVFTACVEESTAQGVLVTAPAGTGKSRLRHEFLRRLERHESPPLVLLGRGDPMSSGSADGLLGQALRRLCGITGAEPLEERRALLSRRLSQHLPEARAREGVEWLGELCAIPFSDAHSPLLRAARGDPRMMSGQVSRALVAFLSAECAQRPVLLVLEDLHWGDLFSVQLMDEARRELAEQSFMVLALARPEVEQLLPGTWGQRLQSVPLRGLSRKAGVQLVREVLGAQAPAPLVDQLVEQAAGNALFLEELIRAVVEGRGEGPPETVLVMLQARLMRLEPEARQVLLAASFFGRVFWAAGVRALLGDVLSDESLEHHLRRLAEQEWVERQPVSRLPGEAAWRFRHALVRDAAYDLVPEGGKSEGHRRVGDWLERSGEGDPRVLAEHASLGGQPERAIQFQTWAAEQLFERYDIQGAARYVEAALALGARGRERVRLRAIQTAMAFWAGDFETLFEMGPEVLPTLSPGSRLWYWLMTGLYIGTVMRGHREQGMELERELLRTVPEATSRAACLEALCSAACMDVWCSARPEAAAFVARLLELGTGITSEVPLEQAWLDYAQGFFSLSFEARPWQARAWAERAYRVLLDVGLMHGVMGPRGLWAQALEHLGDRAGAEVRLRENMALTQQLGQHLMRVHSGLHLGLLLAGSAEPSQRREALSLARQCEAGHIPLYAGLDHLLRAKVAAGGGELAEAEARARAACEQLATFFSYQLMARTLLSQVLLAQGRASEAREQAALGVRRLEQCDSEGAEAVGLRLALAEACLSEGALAEGEAALRQALHCLRHRAGDIPEPAARERFLRQVPENVRLLERARERWGPGELADLVAAEALVPARLQTD